MSANEYTCYGGSKLTDMDKFELGILKQEETWWGKKIRANADLVRTGAFGEVWHERVTSSGDCDGAQIQQFSVGPPSTRRILKATESGVFEKTPSGGWARIGGVK